jgi:hypothetical protein
MEKNMISDEILDLIVHSDNNELNREIAKELLEYRRKYKHVSDEPEIMLCDDCDLTMPCCKNCLGV